MKTAIIKRSIVLDGHKTSVSLENEFWDGLREIADRNRANVSSLVRQIDHQRTAGNLSSAIRVYVFNHYRSLIKPEQTTAAVEQQPQHRPALSA